MNELYYTCFFINPSEHIITIIMKNDRWDMYKIYFKYVEFTYKIWLTSKHT